ncbi:hypothetical protein [Pollutibacter soli]|uniref:hypothetical protein n=1 Tax=Pollutibacter soli TaxID=3034157 RepID=UPI003013F835
MNKAFTRYVTTSFLLLVFSMNSLLGFACSAGWNLGFNAGHHQHEKTAEHHSPEKASHHHSDDNDREKPATEKEKNNDCCAGNVLTISLADKSVPKSVEKINPVYTTLFSVVHFFKLSSPHPDNTKGLSSYLIPGHHPPIPDIRIAIQSFQI